ncbi:hypothetical protein [Limnospira platensis]|uniref:hypothetical protein n=1 Tax=Limnospira platensis TaxID=118562 RepID=UPI00396C3349
MEERNPTLPSLTLQGLLLGFTQPTRFTVGFHPTYYHLCWVSPNLQGLVSRALGVMKIPQKGIAIA